MADIRINSLPTTASASSSDDFLALDGATNGTRKLNAFSPTFGGNLTVSGTGSFGGATGPHTFGNGAGAVEVRAVGDSSGYYGYSFYTGGSYESSLKHTAGSGILKLDVGRNSAWGGVFEIYADTTRAARFAKTSTTLDGNLTVSGTGNSSFAGNIRLPWSTPSLLSYYDATYSLGFVFDSANRKLVLRAQSADAPANQKGTIAFESGATPSEIARFAPSTGNFLIGTPIDSSNGRLQLATHTTSAGGIGFGTADSFYTAGVGDFRLKTTSAEAAVTLLSGGAYIGSVTAGKSTFIVSGSGTTALTLDSSQNATFAGGVTSNGTGFGVGANSTANTPFYALSSVNGTFGMLVKNTNAGSGAFAGVFIEADSGQASIRQHSTLHSVWPGKTLISAPSGGTGLVLLTNGAGDAIDFWTNATQALSIDASQNIVPGTAALATTATDGFIYLQTCAGAPTGVPTTYTGRVASIYDTTNNKLYVYNGGWKSVTLA